MIARRRPTVWTNILMFLLSTTFMLVWLPLVRSLFDGVSYQWGLEYFGIMISGRGITPSYLFLVVQFALFAGLFLGTYHWQNRKLFYGLLVIWWIHVFGNLIFDIIKNGATMFHGDTMDVHISLTYIIVPLAIFSLFVIIQIIRTDTRYLAELPWSDMNKILLIVTFAPLPAQGILLAMGEPHGVTDQIGVVISILQCFLIPFILKPYVLKGQVIPGFNSIS